ncbi:triple tyrosine motif-containing protein [Aquimarina gracilis]|uniref:Triple tyrosine motif-containing protein n=2 Tax=Aquimarina gracilis TaxID=874422 RepID=A0ABU5ZS41_9FLAO|nr:triple tyrosine motif-containing protein [Aquimarina gracilis]MEB3344779.1 triple tyrosine motif-containing protein [Aquimarina gracilis]
MPRLTRLALFLLCFSIGSGNAQNSWKKVSEVKNYANNEIDKAAPKTFDITQGSNGIVYFANEYGLLEFTSNTWKILLQPKNRSSINSLLSYGDRIYVGSNNEIGYAARNRFDQTYYVSLNHLLPKKSTSFSQVWGIFEIQNNIYFCSDQQIIKYDITKNKLISISSKGGFKYAAKISNRLLILDNSNRISILIEDKLETVYTPDYFSKYTIDRILPYNNASFLIFTAKNGAFTLKNKKLEPWGNSENFSFQNTNISSGILLNNEIYCIGTTNNGVLFFDKKGKLLQQLNRDNKLLSNTVLDLFIDQSENLWVTLEGSISYIELKSPFYTLSENEGILGSTYDVKKYKNTLYVATSNGLYYSNWPQNGHTDSFSKVTGVEGQIWNLSILNDQLFIGAHNGSYILQNNNAVPISNIKGGWNFNTIPGNKNLILQGTYSGLVVYQKSEDGWKICNKVIGFDETAREVHFEGKYDIWISHGYKGIYRVRLNEDYSKVIETTLYDQKKGFPGNLFISLLDINDQQLFGTQLGIYRYDSKVDSMIIDNKYTSILTNHHLVRRLSNISENEVLFIQGYDRDDDIGIINFSPNGDHTTHRVPFQRLKSLLIPAFEKFIHFDNGDIGFTSKNGLIIYRKDVRSDYNKEYSTLVRNVKIKDSIVYGNVEDYVTDIRKDSVSPPIPFKLNKLSFSYVAPFYEYPKSVVYQTYLEGLDDNWSQWTKEAQKEYNFLPSGEYTFKVRAKNIYDKIGKEAAFDFTIKPPWYRSFPMYFVYATLLVLIIYTFIRIKNDQRKKSMEKLKIAHKREIELQKIKFEEKRLKAKNEKIKKDNKYLKENLESQNKELASSAMQMVQVDNQLLQLKKSLDEIYNQSEGSIRKQLRSTIKTLDDQIKGDNNWKHFETHFNQIHDNSLERLKDEYPNLNHREIRLCAYLKLNLSSKEIAPLMGISYRGVESLRFRVRKKMGLDTSVNLTDFIIRF